MKSLGFQMRLEKLKPEVLRDERLENKNTLISRGKIVFWTCLKGKETLSICGSEEGKDRKSNSLASS